MEVIGLDVKAGGETLKRRLILMRDAGVRLQQESFLFSEVAAREEVETVAKEEGVERVFYASSVDNTEETSSEFFAWCRTQSIGLESIRRWIHIFDPWAPALINIRRELPQLRDELAYENCQDKHSTRRCLQSIPSVAQPRFEPWDPASKSRPTLQFPFICKPRLGAGSFFVYCLESEADLEEYRAAFKEFADRAGFGQERRMLMAEEYVKGDVFEVDGYVYGGRVTICAAGHKHHERIPGNFAQGFAETGGVTYSPFHSIAESFRTWTESVLNAVGHTNGAFHIEGVQNEKGTYLLEVNSRQGGGGVVEIVKALSKVDLNRQCVRLGAGAAPDQYPSPACEAVAYSVFQPRHPSKVSWVADDFEKQEPFGTLVWKADSSIRSQSGERAGGRAVGVKQGEDYLGEVHAHFSIAPQGNWRSVIGWLNSQYPIASLVDLETIPSEGPPESH